jgi:hypothetical protein
MLYIVNAPKWIESYKRIAATKRDQSGEFDQRFAIQRSHFGRNAIRRYSALRTPIKMNRTAKIPANFAKKSISRFPARIIANSFKISNMIPTTNSMRAL